MMPASSDRPKHPSVLGVMRALSRPLALLGSTVLLTACAVGPDFKRPEVSLNGAWSAKDDPRFATQTAADSQWWRAFEDPALDHLIAIAHAQNLPLQIAALRIVEARAQLGIAKGTLFPQVQQLGGGVQAVRVPAELVDVFGPNSASQSFVAYEAGFDAAWELDLWGKYRRGVESQVAAMFSSVADYYSAIVSLTAEVARTYAVIRELEVHIEEARANVSVQEKGLELTEARFRNGATTELDVAQATTLLESTRASVPQLQTSLQQARNALSTLLGQTTGTVDALLAGPKDIPKVPTKVAISVPAEMLRRRPDIRRAELDAAAQCARIGVAKAALYPSFSLVGSVGLLSLDSSNVTQNFVSSQSLSYIAGPQITFPFFNYGRLENGVRVQDARFQQLLVAYHDTVLKAAQEVEDALTGFVNSQQGVVNDENAVKSAQRAVEISMAAYTSGAVEYQRVLDAQRALLERQNELTKVRSSVVTYLIAIYKALGGGWQWSQGQALVPEPMQKEMRERTNWGDRLSQPRPPVTNLPPPPANR